MKSEISLKDKISVCICTYKRPQLLREALYGISKQITNDFFTIEIVVVFNLIDMSKPKHIFFTHYSGCIH